ncbi:hypothetical protein AJ79_07770 [Helicocarpus griseus UAMH5409]|uniref:C2H2-type domain-containing protein n=1 Tax=Helicocarpus griseus UAMH5409 TaxID=1447875 RepID=A0A2B7WZA2_9EURO|nr:hypothetical protein AJ79_07770 [Helicocarpus griseus UAMH5409]
MTPTSLLASCLKLYEELDRQKSQLPDEDWEGELGRLRTWGHQIGIYQRGQYSFNFLLRYNRSARQEFLRILECLRIELSKILEVAKGEHISYSVTDGPNISFDLIYGHVQALYTLSSRIRRDTHHDINAKCTQEDIEEYAPADKEYVRKMFPQAAERVVERSGESMARRRYYLKVYKQFCSDPDQSDNRETAAAASLPRVSVLDGSKAYGFPSPPKGWKPNELIKCPHCHYMVLLEDNSCWEAHVLSDIIPYVCTSPNCSSSELFSRQQDWASHEMRHVLDELVSTHGDGEERVVFPCPLCSLKKDAWYDLNNHVGEHLGVLAFLSLPLNRPTWESVS